MSLYLKHYFDPNMTHRVLRPTPRTKKSSDLYNLGFVQNVEKGQVLAEFVPLSDVETFEPRFVYQRAVFPQGRNTHVDVANPVCLLASEKGFVSYVDGYITVCTSLNVRSDVSFHTGNVHFFGDVGIHGDVRAGFEVRGENVRIQGMVEGGKVFAHHDLAISGGARCGLGNNCLLKAGNMARMAFAEKVEIQARGNVLIEKDCLHSTVYGGNNSLVNGRMVGGTVHGRQSVVVTGDLGNRAAVSTRVFLGYEPLHMRKLEILEHNIKELADKSRHLNAVAGHLPPDANDLTRKLARIQKKRNACVRARQFLLQTLETASENLKQCRLVVYGNVFPGVEVAIGRAFYYVDEPCRSVVFFLGDNEILCAPYDPAKAKQARAQKERA